MGHGPPTGARGSRGACAHSQGDGDRTRVGVGSHAKPSHRDPPPPAHSPVTIRTGALDLPGPPFHPAQATAYRYRGGGGVGMAAWGERLPGALPFY